MTAVVTGELLASVATNTTDTHIVLPDKLSSIKKAENFSSLKLKWNASEEVLSILISFDKHDSWFSQKVPTRPPNGSMLLFDRQNIKDYRKDGYTWKKRTTKSSTSYIREDHCKLKVSGVNCLNVVYTHSAIVPSFHRRIYWLLQNPDIVLVHYLNLIDDLKEQDTYISEKQKDNISCQINSIFSGIERSLIPKLEITESEDEEETNSQSSSNTPKKSQNDKKRFKITITPVERNGLQLHLPSVLNQRVNSPYPVNLWMIKNDVSNLINVTDTRTNQIHSNSIHNNSCHGNCATNINCVPSNHVGNVVSTNHVGNIVSSNSHHGNNLPGNYCHGNILSGSNHQGNSLPSNNVHVNIVSCNSFQNKNGIQLQPISNLQSLSSNRTIQSTALFSPICNVRTLPNQSRNSPVKSHGLTTQSIDLPTSVVRFPGTVTSTLNVPIGIIQQSSITDQHNVPSTSETPTQSVPCSIITSHPQPVHANSVGVSTQPLLFFSSESIPAAARVASTLNHPTNNNMTEINYSVANTAVLTENTTVTTTSTRANTAVMAHDPASNRTSPSDFQFRPVESPQRNVPQGLNETSQNVSLQNNGNAILTSNGNSVVTNDVTLTLGAQWSDGLLDFRSSNQHSAELSSSPSSDYGSLLSESGTRFSGSESMSSEPGSNSCDNGFDGPFRLPAPVTQSSRVTQIRVNNILSSSHNRSLPVRANQPDGFHRDTSTPLDTNHVDMTFDFPELHSLDELDDYGLNFDLNSVLGEYFNSPESASVTSTTESRLHSTMSETSHRDGSWVEKDFSRKGSNETRVQTQFPNPVSISCNSQIEATTTTASTLKVPGGDTQSDNCRTPVNDVVMTTSPSPCPQSSHGDVNTEHQDEASDLSNPQSSLQEVNNNSTLLPVVMPGSACITDFSPGWSYPEGGVKVLVTGEWSSVDMSYTCLFDGCSVEASLVQMGVLRCYCPPHEPGLVTLQVACNGFIVSNACVFEYRAHDSPGDLNTHHEWLAMDDARFKLALLDRLERLESRLSVQSSGGSRTYSETRSQQCRTFEERILVTCRALFDANTATGTTDLKRPYRGMTLMHLAAALGFSKLLREMTSQWQEQQTSELIRQELDPARKDEFNCTPLMWACALGQRAAVVELLCCHANALLVPDACGRLPLQLARDRGYFEIVDCIEEFMTSSPERRSAFNLYLSSEDEDETSESNVPSPSRLTTSSTGTGYYNSPTLPPHSQPMSVETSYTDRACSPMHVEEVNNGSVLLNQALVQIHEMINEAERQADLDSQNLSGRHSIQLSPVQEENERLQSPGGWGVSGSRFRSFSSASSQSSPLTPSSKSSLSPGSPSFLNSPLSSPTVSTDTKEFHEFLCSSKKLLEKNFSELTLTDREQQELYQAALIIQEAYRSYKIRRQQHDQEMQAAVLIQNHYRRYKQFLLYKKRTHAALIIQNQYRAYREHEQFKKSRRAAAIIQHQFRIYRLRRLSQKRRNEHKSKQQEARFMRQSSNRSNSSA